MSLSRLWQHQGKRAEARTLLAPIYGWFTEGFDTADLRRPRRCLTNCHDRAPDMLGSLASRFSCGAIGIPRGTGEAKCYEVF